jgi:hypothetical protein
LGRLSVIWVLGTAGIYGGLYGFSVADRTFVVLGIALTALAVTGVVVTAVQRSWWWSRRQRAWLAGTAEVRTVSPPPESGVYGRCELSLAVTAAGLPVTEAQIRESRVPLSSWPDVGDILPVHVAVDDPRRVRVLWESFRKPEPTSPPPTGEASDDDADYAMPVFTEEELDGIYADDPGYLPSPRLLPLEDEPTSTIARYLFPTERFRGEWKKHWVRPGVRYTVTLGLAVAGEILVRRYVPQEYLTAARVGVAVLGGLIALHVLFAWYEGRFVLTNKRVMLVEGVLRRRVSMVPLLRVTDLRYEQSLPGRLLSYGDFVLEGMGFFSRIRRITALPDPNELYLRIVEEMYEPGAVEARLGRDPMPSESD